MNRVVLCSFLLTFFISACKGHGVEQSILDGQGLKTNKTLQYFMKKNPGKKLIKYEFKDLNDDGREDLLVLYQVSKEKNMMCVILNFVDHYIETNEVPAPVSNQVIHFKNIDEKPPMEFIVQGMKGAKVGYAIYRIENGQLVDLFGEGMEDCC